MVACAALRTAPLAGQEDAARGGYHLDFGRLAWATPGDERRDRAALDSLVARLSRAPIPATSAALGRLLRQADPVAMLVSWHADYWHLLSALDTRDQRAGLVEDSLYHLQDSALALATVRLTAVDSARLAALLSVDPSLAPYRPFVMRVRHNAGRDAPRVANTPPSIGTAWQFPLYEQLLGRTSFGSVAGPAGPLDVRRQWLATQASPDSAVRREAFDKLYAGYAGIRDLLAFAVSVDGPWPERGSSQCRVP